MTLHHAVLALLSAKLAHDYELKSGFKQAVGDQWGGLNIGHLYQVLDRAIHRLTPVGRAQLDRWVSEPAIAARGYRDDFFLKIMASVSLLITAAELHLRTDLGVVDAAEKVLTTDSAAPSASSHRRA